MTVPSRRRSGACNTRVIAVFNPRVMVCANRCPVKSPAVAPAVENDAGPKGLACSCHHYAIVLAPGARAGLPPMKLQRPQLQPVELCQKVFRPLKTKAAFPNPGVHQEVVEKRRPDDTIIARQLLCRPVSTFRDTSGFLGMNITGKRRDACSESFRSGKIPLRHCEPIIGAAPVALGVCCDGRSKKKCSEQLFQPGSSIITNHKANCSELCAREIVRGKP